MLPNNLPPPKHPPLQTAAQSQHPSTRILATSRRERDIDECLSVVADYNVDIQSAVVDQDIRLYVQDRLSNDSKLQKWPTSVQEEISQTLMEKAGGMFRWVFCQLEAIRQCIRLTPLRKTLATLPQTLDETYERVLQKLDSAGQLGDAIKALQWLCFAHRPLSLLEIREVLAIENGEDGAFFPEERLPDPTDVTVICSSLIVCGIKGHNPDNICEMSLAAKNGNNIHVRLAHFSVKEYLLDDRCAYRSKFQASLCHTGISEGCLHYMLFFVQQNPLTRDIINEHPLAEYAAEYWWQHVWSVETKAITRPSANAG